MQATSSVPSPLHSDFLVLNSNREDFLFFLNSALLTQLALELIGRKICAGQEKGQQWVIVRCNGFCRKRGRAVVNCVRPHLKIRDGSGVVYESLNESLNSRLLRRSALRKLHAHTRTRVHDANDSFDLQLELAYSHH